MAINANEMALLLSELPLKDSVIQAVTEHNIHSFTLSLFSRSEKAWLLYVEIGTPSQHFCRTGIMRKKAAKLQRFGQYMRANIVGSRIEEVHQVPGERLFLLKCTHQGEMKYLIFRFYTGPGANVIITDSSYMILELLMRRPQRGEEKGFHFTLPEDKVSDLARFPIRPYTGDSFNAFMDLDEYGKAKSEELSELQEKLAERMQRELAALRLSARNARERAKANEDYESYKTTADLLSSYSYQLRRGDEQASLYDFEGNAVTIALDRTLSPSENINAYYQKYKRSQRIYESALEEAKEAEEKEKKREASLQRLLAEGSAEEISRELGREEQRGERKEAECGIAVSSHGFDILVGRNSKENAELLRHHTRGSDMWMHTRDFPGGYVIIKAKKGKSIPLEVLLDAANLAIHYSKAKSSARADLYYTEVKYLRKPKGGKEGLVLPTQEKNLTVTLDPERIRKLLFDIADNQEN